MPVYEYECESCGVVEVSQSIKDEPLLICTRCGCENFKKIISLSSFRLKGAGFYENDYKKKKQT